ncbi:ATP-grasp domain-containing protein [Streptomyces sp. NPDC049585]|uniref:ATP-grasp domain-containing protein n=1 Tax=Streptomyces sp. NPDC049585 TaxID=3155154 RepID=UPI003441B7E9
MIVDPYSSGMYFAPAFREAGVPVVAVLSRPPVEVYASSWHPEDFDEVIRYDEYDGDLAAVAARLKELDPCCVVAGTETGVELADRLAAQTVPERANVPALGPARWHKGEMAKAVARAGLPVVPQICTDDAGDVESWIAREGLTGADLVIKPPRSAGTDGVVRVPGGRGWREAFDAQLGRRNQWGVLNDRMLVMQYVTGTEFVVDTFTHDGRHTVTDVTRYSKIDNGAHMAVYDTMEWLAPNDAVVPELVAYTRGVLDAVGMRFGAAHVEVMLTQDGPRLIELNARPHGGGQPRFCRRATGDSQIDRTVRSLVTARPQDVPEHYALLRHTLVVFLVSRSAGVVSNAEVFDGVQDLPSLFHASVHVANGQHLRMTKDLLATLSLGFVVLSHADREQVWEDCRAIREMEKRLVLQEPGPAA